MTGFVQNALLEESTKRMADRELLLGHEYT